MRLKISYIAIFMFFAMSFEVRGFCISTPSTSLNTLFLYRNSNFHKEDVNASAVDDAPNGLSLQEAELQFFSDVDPYTKLTVILAVAPHYTSDGQTVSEEWELSPEEVFAESTSVPGVTLKVGKFKAFLGKHNTLHTHAFPFVEAPLANVGLLGDEGFNDTGVSAAVMLPTSWFNELTLQYLRGKGENSEFSSPSPSEGVGVVHWKNLLDLNEDATMELGASFGAGENSYKQKTSVSGVDLTFKWRPSVGGKYQSLIWSSEFLARTQEKSGVADERGSGVVTWLQYQFAERWAAIYRFDNLVVQDSLDPSVLPNATSERHSFAVTYAPSEFSSYKIEYFQKTGAELNQNGEDTERSILVQANYTMGAHPTHSY